MKRLIDLLFVALAVTILGSALLGASGCTSRNPNASAGMTLPFSGRWAGAGGAESDVDAAPVADDAPDAAGGRPGASDDAAEPDAGELPDAAVEDALQALDGGDLGDLRCSPVDVVFRPWASEACAGRGEGASCDNLGQWEGEARCVRLAADLHCRDNPTTPGDECFGCAACE